MLAGAIMFVFVLLITFLGEEVLREFIWTHGWQDHFDRVSEANGIIAFGPHDKKGIRPRAAVMRSR
jgi:hypothetical protein